MKIFDSHAHYEDALFDSDRYEVLESLKGKNGGCILNCCSDETVFSTVMDLVHRYDFVYGSIGIHPHWVCETSQNYLDRIRELIKDEKIVAIGEMGLDYYWQEPKDLQKHIFIEQLKLAKEVDMPVIIHDREAHTDVLEILRQYQPQGVLHRFGGPVEMANEVMDWGMYISFNNDLDYPQWNQPHIDVLMATPWDRLLIETDCPYAPPYKNKDGRCTSADCDNVISMIAKLRNVDEEFVAQTAYENAMRVYRINK